MNNTREHSSQFAKVIPGASYPPGYDAAEIRQAKLARVQEAGFHSDSTPAVALRPGCCCRLDPVKPDELLATSDVRKGCRADKLRPLSAKLRRTGSLLPVSDVGFPQFLPKLYQL